MGNELATPDTKHTSREASAAAPARSPVTPTGAATLKRLTELPPTIDVGEQIVGSDHVFELAVPFNVGVRSGPAVARVRVEPSESFTSWRNRSELAESESMTSSELGDQLAHPIKLGFHPQRRGEHHGVLVVVATWRDGHEERQEVQLVGRARQLTDVPEHSSAPAHDDADATRAPAHGTGAATAPAHGTDCHASRSDAYARFDTITDGARDAAAGLAAAQKSGMEKVEKEVGNYRPPPRPRSLWWDLAQFALIFGSAGVAEIAGKTLALGLAHVVVEDATGDSRMVTTIAKELRDGIRLGAKTVADAIPKSSAESHKKTVGGVIPFFEAQRDALDALASANRNMITKHKLALLPLLGTNSNIGPAVMEAIQAALEHAAPSAKDDQADVTASQWLAYRARTRLGMEIANGEPTTNLSGVRDASSNRTFAGLLDLRIDVRNHPARLVAARAAGIDQEIAVHFDKLNLGNAHIPVRIILGSEDAEPTVITRDEAGRVRVSGGLYHLARYTDGGVAPANEVQAERAARLLCETVLAKTLADWGVSIATPDQKVHEREVFKDATAKQLGFGPSAEEVAGAEDTTEE